MIKPDTVISVPDQITMGDTTVSDAWYHPTERFTATGILAESSNVGTLKIAQRIGPKVWDRYERRFGVGTKTGIELPGESSGYLPPMSQWSGSSFANLPFGQGESMTVLQLASIYQTFANNGVQVEPRIVQSVTAPRRHARRRPSSPKGKRVITAQTAQTVRTMLESVTLPGGTGTKAAIPGYRVAGKTGTAQQPDPNHGGAYSSWMNWDTFAGMIPADDPQFVVAIMVDNPAHGARGRRRRGAAVPRDRQLRAGPRAHPADRFGIEARAAAGLRRGHPDGVTQYRLLTCLPRIPRSQLGPESRGRPGSCRSPLSSLAAVAGPGARRGRQRSSRSPACRCRARSCAPGDLFAGAPGHAAHGASYAAQAVAAGAVAVLTDAAGAALVPAGVPVLVVADVRAAVGPVAGARLRRPERRARRARRDRHERQDDDDVLRARRTAGGRTGQRPDRHGGHADRRRRDQDRVHHARGAGDCRRCSR